MAKALRGLEHVCLAALSAGLALAAHAAPAPELLAIAFAALSLAFAGWRAALVERPEPPIAQKAGAWAPPRRPAEARAADAGAAAPAAPPPDDPPEEAGAGWASALALGCGPAPRPRGLAAAERMARGLQDTMAACQAKSAQRRRIFDDCTVERGEGDAAMALTEFRGAAFQRLRAAAGLSEEEYFDAMCAQPFSGGKLEVSGKSGSIFLRSHDNRLVIKTIEDHEIEVLKAILPHLLLYLEQHPGSLLCRFMGAYALRVGASAMHFVVMENLLQRPAHELYDLKGTTEDRWVDPASGGVLKDLNFAGRTVLLQPPARAQLVQALCDDAEFLESIGVMDYSILLGVAPAQGDASAERPGVIRGAVASQAAGQEACDLQLGIIDYLQRWTPKKVAAHWLKKASIGCFHEIDTEPPAVYCRRFCKCVLATFEGARR